MCLFETRHSQAKFAHRPGLLIAVAADITKQTAGASILALPSFNREAAAELAGAERESQRT